MFDFDGVIANSEPLHLRAFQDVLAAAEITLTEREYYGNYLGFDDAGVFRAVDANRGTHWTAADIDTLVSRKTARLEALEHGVSLLFPGAADAIRRLASALPLAIASGANGRPFAAMMATQIRVEPPKVIKINGVKTPFIEVNDFYVADEYR